MTTREIKFFDPNDSNNACIQPISDMTSSEIEAFARIQDEIFGRSEFEFLNGYRDPSQGEVPAHERFNEDQFDR